MSSRHVCKAWAAYNVRTLEEVEKWIVGGITGDGRVPSTQTAAELDHQTVLDRIQEQLGSLVDTVHHVDNVFDLLVHLRKRKSEHVVDRVAALIFPLRFKAIPIYDETLSVKDL
ncbi:hypothetical protein ARMGADRAFT_1079685 [Armillaria gallica]|uniref:Uncharacterized protein n=1 Tax=Armillaria gallica TaxID=47427 RepID=A0A2H3DPE6_ARMGA|nr:hypothetical protein ARMGADRAFT_1079685 [Armillaria gallica]